MSQKLSTEEVKLELSKKNLVLIGEYKNMDSPIKCMDEEGYLVYPNLGSIRQNKTPGRFYYKNPDFFYNIELWLKKTESPYLIIKNQKSEYSKSNLTFHCTKCNSDFSAKWYNIHYGYGCPYCVNLKVLERNSLAAKRPDLLKYFENSDDAKKIAPHSGKTVELKCPECGNKQNQKINNLSRSGFTCKFCSDGISTPEKFLINLLVKLKIDFIPQYSPEWLINKRYDFYLPEQNLIIEAHGEQHYKDKSRKGSRTFSEEQLNDIEKEFLAKQNQYRYVVIDCRESSFNWLKENAIKELKKYIDLSDIDWKNIYENSRNSLCVEAWNLWDNGIKSTLKISKILKINRRTVLRYLKNGSEIGKIDYNPEKENHKGSGEEHYKKRKKAINQYTLSGDFVKRWDSATDIWKETGIGFGSVSQCALGKIKTAKGFIWRFADDL